MAFGRTSLKPIFVISKTSLKRTVQFLTENSYFTVGNVLLLQTVDISMGINSSPLWAKLYLYNWEFKYITNLTRTNKLRGRRFHSSFRFIDDF